MELGLEGRVALVAASSRGLGRAVAEELAEEGADLVVNARGEETLQETARAIRESTGVRVLPVAADLSERRETEALVEAALDEFGRVDVLVTNTGGPPPGPFEDHSAEAWRDAYRTILESARTLIRGVLPGMKERGWGRILTITSIAVKQPVDGLILSNSLRAGLTGMVRTLANELADSGITVNNLMPGYTRTERLEELAGATAEEEGVDPSEVFARWERQIPAGRLGQPRELAALAAFLASERAAYITGSSIPVDGGWIRSLL